MDSHLVLLTDKSVKNIDNEKELENHEVQVNSVMKKLLDMPDYCVKMEIDYLGYRPNGEESKIISCSLHDVYSFSQKNDKKNVDIGYYDNMVLVVEIYVSDGCSLTIQVWPRDNEGHFVDIIKTLIN